MIATARTTRDPLAWREQHVDELALRPAPDAAVALAADPDRGLPADEAAARLAAAGPNEPAPVAGVAWPAVLAHQFASKLILLLVVATIVTLLLGEWLNMAAIGVTVLVSATFGFLNEYRAERAIAALRGRTARSAEVVRDGLHEDIPAAGVVPGDLLVLAEGSVVAADARLVDVRGLRVDESLLTGEPEAVTKSVSASPEDDRPAALTAVYAGATVVAGSGLALVVATGPRTLLGGIAVALQRGSRRATPLEERLEHLGNRLIAIFLALCALLVVVGLAQGRDLRLVVTVAVALAVGAVPEGLPAVATTTLAVAVRRLAARGVLVRRLDAVETLGSTTVIVTDKTGTLTENRMAVRSVLLANGRDIRVAVQTGDGATLRTALTAPDGDPPAPEDVAAARRVLLVAALCNDAVAEHDATHGWHVHGDPSEGAIILAAAGLGDDDATRHARYSRLATEPFTSATRLMRTTHATPDGGRLVALKGAFEQVVALTGDEHRALAAAVHDLGDAGLRVFTVAEATSDARPQLLGAVVLEDPLRPDAAAAVSACHAAGIRVMLVTGDQLATATTVARQTGMLGGGNLAVRAQELDLTDLGRVAVVARATHTQKVQIVQALQASGEVVAMTGDGVNDAAALQAAHVGVAVGPRATDVAVEAAHVVLTDGRLASLVRGITAGRVITRSLREAIMYLLTASFGTILLVTLGTGTARPEALAPLQILWLNLVVHIFPALALALNQEQGDITQQPTRTLMPPAAWWEIAWRAVSVGAAGLAALLIGERQETSPAHGQTLVFLTLALGLVGQVFLIGVNSFREQRRRLARPAIWAGVGLSLALLLLAVVLPGLRDALGVEPAEPADWGIALALAAGAATAARLGTLLTRRYAV